MNTTKIYTLIWTLHEDMWKPYRKTFHSREDALEFAQNIEDAKAVSLYTEIREEIKI